MTVNVFEGCRRIGYALQLLVVVMGLGLIAIDEPYIVAQFNTTGPDAPFTLANDDAYCGHANALEVVSDADLGDNRQVSIRLCFLAKEAESGCMMVPYKKDPRGTTASGTYNTQSVITYTAARAEKFELTPEDRAALLEHWHEERGANIRDGLITLFLSWLSLFVAIKMLGWIARGFLNLKPGQDTPTAS